MHMLEEYNYVSGKAIKQKRANYSSYLSLINCKKYAVNLFCVSVSELLYVSISSNNFGSELDLKVQCQELSEPLGS